MSDERPSIWHPPLGTQLLVTQAGLGWQALGYVVATEDGLEPMHGPLERRTEALATALGMWPIFPLGLS